MNKYGESLGETKTHFKMYKKGRNWMIAGIAVTSFGLSAFGLGTQNAKAATAVADDSNSSVVSSVANTGNSATLKAGQANATTDDSSATATSAGTTTDTTASGAATSTKNNETNQASAANAESAQTDSNDGAAGETVDASANNTTNNVAENATVTTSDEYQSVATTNVSDGDSVSKADTDADSVQVTDLKEASDADFATAKQAAAETYKTTGVAQKITRTAAAVTNDAIDMSNFPSQFTVADTPTGTDIADGTYGTSDWKITEDGTLSIGLVN
ncbi:KxYKxGKxW signal peptide domain-containing protein [Secundilactobacillus similis]|uniref:KxYKxGKxW signal peptide domain-containing protein n=1 Tax=Secundilactobacillus similis TaxID=414682 RepID=UPI0006CFA60C|nr:KxYKxGKxW signal peptide domain-containing protein [Secundilactobacillus similis]